jgi:hypothetical protein
MKEDFNIHGSMTAVLTKPDGTVIVRRKDNLILSAGFDFIANAMCATTSRPNVMNVIGVGTGTTAAAASQTALVNQLLAQTATYAHTASTKTFTLTTTFAAGKATGAITEAAVMNATSSGTLLDRVVFSVINKGASDTLKVTFTFTMS